MNATGFKRCTLPAGLRPLAVRLLAAGLLATGLVATACGPSQQVTRIDMDEEVDLTGRWNERDARMVTDSLMSDALSHHWLEQYTLEQDEEPVIIVGTVRNETMEHIDTEVITNALETQMMDTGRVDFVADPDTREQIREERLDQQQYADPESAARLASETGADLMLNGSINAIYDETEAGDRQSVYYSVSLQLTDLETNRVVWRGTEEIRKLVKRDRIRRE